MTLSGQETKAGETGQGEATIVGNGDTRDRSSVEVDGWN